MKTLRSYKSLLLLFIVLSVSVTACGELSDMEVICERMGECKTLEGLSEASCVEAGNETKATSSDKEDCAVCVSAFSCKELANGECDTPCDFKN